MKEQILDINLVLRSINGKIDSLSKQLDSAHKEIIVLKKENAVLKERLAVYETPKDSFERENGKAQWWADRSQRHYVGDGK